VTTASRSRNGGYGNGNGRSSAGLAGPRSVERRRLKSGAPAHAFTTEERRRGAERTNEIAMAIAITDRIRELGLDADAENIAGEGLRQPGE
jgi:hypothetical protein